MLLYKPLLSMLAVFAAAGSVAAQCNGGSDPPSLTPIPASQCNTGPVQCCNTYTSPTNGLVTLLSGLLGISVNPTLGVGLSCLSLIGGAACSNTAVCCNNIHQSGLINVGCTPVTLGI
ncbi:fungal hydrophobin [Russula earlei]|uniref:Fungal hydrophobin n=1 Tax=Russula earlei TaxID=71964 RepID=A0ACC0U6G0_9AGAM|nr:fungal hydrophobin [Russula earlei]